MKTFAMTIAVLIVVSPAAVHAQGAAADVHDELPGFATLDRGDDRSRTEVALSFTKLDVDDQDANARLDVYGQIIGVSGFGAYGSFLVSYMDEADDETALGNLELGGLYTTRSADSQLVLRGGVTLPTADDEFAGFLTNGMLMLARLTDMVDIAPDSSWLRLAVSALHRSDKLFVRGDLGLDSPITEPDGVNLDAIIRLNVGAGYAADSFAAMGELVTVGTTGDTAGDKYFHTLALTARARGRFAPFASVIVPLDEAIDGVSYTLMAGVQLPMAAQ